MSKDALLVEADLSEARTMAKGVRAELSRLEESLTALARPRRHRWLCAASSARG
jgi:hypothetical protein